MGGPWLGAAPRVRPQAKAGVSPLRILQSTILNAARFLDRDGGTVEVGRPADLVLLNADPTASVANLHDIAGVVRAGSCYPAAALADIKRGLVGTAN